jgi:hypothetical protein
MEGNFILLLILAIFGASANTLLFKGKGPSEGVREGVSE